MATNTQLRNILRTIVIIDKEAKCKDNQQHNLTSGLNDFIELKIKDLTDMRYIYRTKGNVTDKIPFVVISTRRLKCVLHWVQDYVRCNELIDPSNIFSERVNLVLQRDGDRKICIDQKDINSTISKPGKFIKEQDGIFVKLYPLIFILFYLELLKLLCLTSSDHETL